MTQATILTENFAGMKTQALGLAERAGFDKELCCLTPKKPWSLISAPYWPFPQKAVNSFRVSDHSNVIISVGSVGGVVNASIRKAGRIAIHIQNPRIALEKFDLVIVNPHDNINGSNVLVARTALHHVTPDILKENREVWLPIFNSPPKPIVSVLIGGNNGRFTLGRAEAVQISDQLITLIKDENVHIILTPSRRTDPEAIQIFTEKLVPYGAFVWNGTGDNPYLGMLSCADYILVTTDSVSMISEAVATNVPVMIIPLPGKSKRISYFIQSMQKENRVKLFSGKIDIWSIKPIDDTEEIVHVIQKKLSL